jgi:predicted AAA+ superfamily ATPase
MSNKETRMPYKKRIVEEELATKLNASGAVLIKGAKSCGKTETAKRFAKSVLQTDQDEQVPYIMQTEPKRLLIGETPRLIDEWQEQPKLWNYVRHEIDDRKEKAQFILTGSANPNDNVKMHSGAGRFTTLNMRTMSWQEMGYSSGKIRLKDLLEGKKNKAADTAIKLETIIDRIIKGGWPGLLKSSQKEALLLNRAYIDLLAEVDMSRVSNIKRDPVKVKNLLRSLARNTAALIDNTTIAKDIKEHENADISRPTLIDYLDALEQLMITENQPAWNTHIRSSASLRKSPKRHLTDVSLAVAALKADKEMLLNDVKFTGFLFESLAIHDLRVYAQSIDAEVSYYRDSSGLEVDAIVQKYNGDWAAFEVKLGVGMIDEAAENLLKFAKVLDNKKTAAPKSLNIIVGTGMSYVRQDAINVISIASLGQ